MTQQELLWKYAEGQCSPAEKEQVKKLLSDSHSAQAELNQIKAVHSVLQKMAPASPSMRFQQNVLEALPDIYATEKIEPLISPIWKKLFWASGVLSFLFILWWSQTRPSPGGSTSPLLGQIVDSFYEVVGQIPVSVMQYFVLTLLSMALLALMDRWVLRRMGRGFFMCW